MANTKVTGDLLADGTLFARHLNESHGITTSVIGEGTNLFYTDTRVGTYLGTYLPANGYDTATNIIASIVDSAPVTLDTLNELAAALGDDPNFATTVTNSLAGKLPLTGGTLTGNLGIGASPNYPFHISSTSVYQVAIKSTGAQYLLIGSNDANTAGIILDGDSNGDGAGGDYSYILHESTGVLKIVQDSPSGTNQISFGTAGVENKVVIDASGQLGIGTTSPGAKLHIVGDTGGADSIARFQNTNAVKVTRLQLLDSAGNVGDGFIAYNHSDTDSQWHYLGLGINNSTSLIVNNNDNVGIGTTLPSYKLTVKSAGISTFPLAVTNTSNSLIGGIYQTAGGDGQFYLYNSAGAENVKISSVDNSYFNGGNVGIGTTSPSDKLSVYTTTDYGNNSTYANATIGLGNQAYPVSIRSYRYGGSYLNGLDFYYNNATPQLGMRIDANGNFFTTGNSTLANAINSPIVNVGNYPVFEGQGASAQFGFSRAGTGYVTYIGSDSSYLFRLWNESFNNGYFNILQNGNVGIGTTSPAGKLSVEAPGNHITLRAPAAAAGKYWALDVSSANQFYLLNNAGTKYLTMTDSGNVGINTPSPQAKLHIGNDGSNSYATLRLEGSNAGGRLDIYNGSYPVSEYLTDQSGNTYISTSGGFGSTSLSYRFTILTEGNVGIGTTSPVDKLEIYAATYNKIRTFFEGSYTSGFKFSDYNGGIRYDAGVDRLTLFGNHPTAGNITFETAGSERMCITSGGNVGIGTTSPIADGLTIRREGSDRKVLLKLDRPNTAGLQTAMQFTVDNIMVGQIQHEYAASNYNHMSFTLRSVGGGDIIPLWLENSGNVGIGTTSPSAKLDVVGGAIKAQHIQHGYYSYGISGGTVGNGSLTVNINFNGFYNTGYVIEVYAYFNHWNSTTSNYTYCYRKGIIMGWNDASSVQIDGPGGGFSDSSSVGAWTFSTDNSGVSGYGQRINVTKSAGGAGWQGTYFIQIVSSVPLDPTDVS